MGIPLFYERCSLPGSTRQLGIETSKASDFLHLLCLHCQSRQTRMWIFGIRTGTNGAGPEDGLCSLTQTREDTLLQQDFFSINSFGGTIWTLAGQLVAGSLETLVVVLGVVDVADFLVLNSLVDGAIHSCAEKTFFEEFGGGREVTRVLLVT